MRHSNETQIIVLAVLLCLGASLALAQYGPSRQRGRDRLPDRAGIPEWQVDPGFKKDVFTFVRVRYGSSRGYGRWGGGWSTDYPDSDLNFSFRLQQLTSLKVDPEGKILELTDKELFHYPFIYMIEPGRMSLTEEEGAALRHYLLNGGFLMVDDFWGERQWENFYDEIKRVFPDREPEELPLSHQIFHCVFDLKEKPQMASIHHYRDYRGTPYAGYEQPDAKEVHYKALYDDKGRMMAIICHNTDLGDGWEREGEDESYFREYAEKMAYPMGINIVFYAMTH